MKIINNLRGKNERCDDDLNDYQFLVLLSLPVPIIISVLGFICCLKLSEEPLCLSCIHCTLPFQHICVETSFLFLLHAHVA